MLRQFNRYGPCFLFTGVLVFLGMTGRAFGQESAFPFNGRIQMYRHERSVVTELRRPDGEILLPTIEGQETLKDVLAGRIELRSAGIEEKYLRGTIDQKRRVFVDKSKFKDVPGSIDKMGIVYLPERVYLEVKLDSFHYEPQSRFDPAKNQWIPSGWSMKFSRDLGLASQKHFLIYVPLPSHHSVAQPVYPAVMPELLTMREALQNELEGYEIVELMRNEEDFADSYVASYLD